MADYSALYQQAGQRFNVDPRLLAAVAQTESSGDPNALGPVTSNGERAAGLMQLMPSTAQALGVKDPTDPAQAIPAAAQVLSQNLAKFGNVADALRAYNSGWDPSKWSNSQTAAYVPKVQAAYAALGEPSTPSAPAGQQTAANGASDVPLTSAAPATSSFNTLFPDLAATPAQSSSAGSGAPSFDRLFPDLASGKPPAPAEQTTSAAAPPSAAPTTIMGQLGAGLKRGATDLTDTLNNVTAWGDRNIPGAQAVDTGLNNLGNSIATATGLPPGDLGRTPAMNQQILQQDAAAQAQYQQQSGQSIPAAIGRVAGNIAVTAPLMALGGSALGGAAEAAGVGSGLTSAASSLPGGNMLLNAGRAIVGGAGAGAIAGGATAGGNDQTVGQGALSGGEVGAVLGPAGALVGKGVSAVGNALTGGTIDGGRQALANMAVKQYGIPLTAPQMGTNGAAKWLADAADTSSGGQAVSKAAGAQQAAFTQAVGRTFGADSPVLTPEVMQAAKDNLGQTFDNIAKQTTIVADQPMTDGLLGIQKEAGQVLPASEVVPIQNQITNVLGAVGNNGTISGQQYQALTRKGAPLDRAIQSDDPNVSFYAQQIRGTLDDAMQRSLQASGQTGLLNQLQAARLSWKNMMTVAPIAAKSLDGTINPALLQGRVNATFQNNAFQGAGDLGNLAKIGQAFLKPQASSGTAERSLAISRISNAAEGIGMLATGHPVMGGIALAKIPVQMGVGRAVGAVMNSRAAANALLARSAPQAADSVVPNNLLGRAGNLAGGYAPQVLPALSAPVNRLLNRN